MNDAVTYRWWPRIAVVILIAAGSVWAGATIRLETELLALLPPHLASVRGLDAFQRGFASDREVILVADESLDPAKRTEILKELRPVLAALPGVESVQTPGGDYSERLPQLAAWALWNMPPEGFTKATAALQDKVVADRLENLPNELAGALDPAEMIKLQTDPLGLIDAISEGNDNPPSSNSIGEWLDRPASALTITSSKPLIAFQDCVNFCQSIKSAINQVLPGEHGLLLTGRPAFTGEISTQMRRDMILMVVVATALSGFAFWAFYRRIRPLGWILLGQFLALGMGLLAARIGMGSLNVISIGFACILLGIGMDYSILVHHHFASAFREDHKMWGRLKSGIWFSAATTAAAFLVLAFSSVPGLRQLAILVAAGLLASAFFATWLLPAAWSRNPPEPPAFVQATSNAMAQIMKKRGRLLLLMAVLCILPAGWKLLHDSSTFFSSDMSRMQPSSSEAYRGQIALGQTCPGAEDAIFIVTAPTWTAVKRGIQEFAARFSGVSVPPLTALLPDHDHQSVNAATWSAGTAPRLAKAFEKAGIGSEWSAPTLEFASTLDRAAAGNPEAFQDVQPLISKLAIKDDAGCRALIRIPNKSESPIPPGGLDVAGAEVLPVSWVALRSELNASSSRDLLVLGGCALAAATLLCALAQRSLRMVLLNLAAVVISLLLLATLLALTGTRLNALTLLCVPLLLGLVIDYSLHVLMALEHDGGDFQKLYAHIGAPILLTGIASCIGFGAPMLTSQPALQNFGIVMDLGIISAVFTCLFLLPVLERLTAHRKPAIDS